MPAKPIWISLSQNNKNHSLLLKIKQLVENKEEMRKILNISGCQQKCTGNCSNVK